MNQENPHDNRGPHGPQNPHGHHGPSGQHGHRGRRGMAGCFPFDPQMMHKMKKMARHFQGI